MLKLKVICCAEEEKIGDLEQSLEISNMKQRFIGTVDSCVVVVTRLVGFLLHKTFKYSFPELDVSVPVFVSGSM